MAHDICPSCGNLKDRRAVTCLGCRPTSSAFLDAGRSLANKLKPRSRSEAYRALLAHAQRVGECLLVTTGTDNDGYRRVRAGGQMTLVHRLAYEMTNGPIPDGMTIDHGCHNDSACSLGVGCPHRRCIEPAHLAPAGVAENWRRGRLGAPVIRRAITHCPKKHEYTPENTYVKPSGARVCRTCSRAAQKIVDARRKAERAARH